MRLRLIRLAGVLAAAGLAGWAIAQEPRRDLEKAELLQNESVQKELKLTPEQDRKFRQVAKDFEQEHKEEIAKARADKDVRKMLELHHKALLTMDKAMEDVLTAEQFQRLGQIEVQSQGVRALMRSEIQKKLGMGERQRGEMRSVYEAMEKELQTLLKEPAKSPRQAEEVARKVRKVHDEARERAEALLNEEQRRTWKDLVGAPFELKMGQPSRPRTTSP
jgi:hypothetical protein